MEWVESTGRSVDDAKEAALDRLGVHEDEAEFDVLTEARVGLFGRVKEDARVRARVRPSAPRAKEQRRRGKGRDRSSGSGGGGSRSARGSRSKGGKDGSGRGESAGKGRNEGQGRNRPRSEARDSESDRDRKHEPKKDRKKSSDKRANSKLEEPPVSDEYDAGPSLDEQAALAEEFVGGLAEKFGKTLTFERDELEDEILRIEASGDDIGILVGRKGTTAQAIDDLVRTVLQRAGGTTREGKIRVDIGGVRARRAAALNDFTRKIASDVIESGVETALEPMGGADRKLVHDVVGEIDGVETRSEGEDPYRRVVIAPVSGER
jgi:spoIIIJ-associated protein